MLRFVKSPILRTVMGAVLLGLTSAILVSIVGLVFGWNTYRQFSDGFFWAGAILCSIGLLSVLGALDARTVSGLQYSETAVHLDAGGRFKIWAADMFRSYHLMAFLGIAGMELLVFAGLAILVGRAL